MCDKTPPHTTLPSPPCSRRVVLCDAHDQWELVLLIVGACYRCTTGVEPSFLSWMYPR